MWTTGLRWTLGTLGVVVASAGAAVLLARHLAGCYVATVPLPAEPLCGPGVWGTAAGPALLLLVTVALLGVWGVAAVRTARRQFGGARRFRTALLAAAVDHPRTDAAATGLGVPVVASDVAVPLAVTVGWFRPRIIVTVPLLDRLDDQQLDAVLQHEAHHAHRHDPLLFGVVRTVADALFLLPVVRRWADRVVVDAEVAADAAAIEAVGRRPLLGALDAVTTPAATPVVAHGSLHGMLDQRIEVLAGRPLPRASDRRATALSLAGVLLVLAPVGGVATAAHRAGWAAPACDAAPGGCAPPDVGTVDGDPTVATAPEDPQLPPGAPSAPDGMFPVVGRTGAMVGFVEIAATDRVAREGGRAPVVDADGTQVGWFTAGGFVPLDDDPGDPTP